MARAFGSYPEGRWFESNHRYHVRPIGQVVKTPPSHGGNRGSNPLWVTIWALSSAGRASALQAGGHRFEPYSAHHLLKVWMVYINIRGSVVFTEFIGNLGEVGIDKVSLL